MVAAIQGIVPGALETSPLQAVSGPAGLTPSVEAGAASPQGDFASVVAGVLSELPNQLRAAEATSVAGMQGHADMMSVVSQLMQAEQQLQTAIAVRDKVVAAYLEVSRMSI